MLGQNQNGAHAASSRPAAPNGQTAQAPHGTRRAVASMALRTISTCHTTSTHTTQPLHCTRTPHSNPNHPAKAHPLRRAHLGWNGTGNEITPTTSNACPCAAAAARSSTASWIPYPAHAPFQPPRWWTPGDSHSQSEPHTFNSTSRQCMSYNASVLAWERGRY